MVFTTREAVLAAEFELITATRNRSYIDIAAVIILGILLMIFMVYYHHHVKRHIIQHHPKHNK